MNLNFDNVGPNTDWDPKQDSIESQMFDAIKNNDLATVRSLIDSGADVQENLLDACILGNASVVKILIEAGARVIENENDELLEAAYRDHKDVVKLLIDNGATSKFFSSNDYRLILEGAGTEMIEYIKDYEKNLRSNI